MRSRLSAAAWHSFFLPVSGESGDDVACDSARATMQAPKVSLTFVDQHGKATGARPRRFLERGNNSLALDDPPRGVYVL